MSGDVSASSKTQAKKAQRDADRRRDRGKKRKHAEVEDGIPKPDFKEDFLSLNDAENDVANQADPKSSKAVQEPPGQHEPSDSEQRGRRLPDAERAERVAQAPVKRRKPDDTTTVSDKDTKSRFIVFIGNLPYSTTDASLNLHFQKLAPFTLRHRLDPKTKKSKGFAFLEFENFDRMKTCLKLYHHSMFDPEAKESTLTENNDGRDESIDTGIVSAKTKRTNKRARRINVELTAGGGGKNENRKEKIKAKNVRLEEQRKRRAEQEKREKASSAAKKSKRTGANMLKPGEEPTEDSTEQAIVVDTNSSIHPSRLARMKQ